MIENCTLYLPTKDIPLKEIFPEGKSNGGWLRKATQFEYPSEQGLIRLNFSSTTGDDEHLSGFKGYVGELENTEVQKRRAMALIDAVKLVLGVELPCAVESDSEAFQSLMHLADVASGFIFVEDSILIPSEGFIVGPLSHPEPAMEAALTVELTEEAKAELEEARAQAPAHLVAMRDQNMAELREAGFRCADWMPFKRNNEILRPTEEIAKRLCALTAIFAYVADSGIENVQDDQLKSFVELNGLCDWFTEEEAQMFGLDRSEANVSHRNTIGWKLENMWALSWVLGFESDLPYDCGMLSDEVTSDMFGFLPTIEGVVHDFSTHFKVRTCREVVEKEDLFFCAHNAARSAQMGRPTVPADFHPVIGGGAIHERRHALTWCLAPECPWDETDLST